MPDDKKKKLLESLDKAINRERETGKTKQPVQTNQDTSLLDDVTNFLKPYGDLQQTMFRQGEAIFKVLEEPGRLMNKGISQLTDNPLAGITNIGNSLLTLTASPFGIADAMVRELPTGDSIADAVAYPFGQVSLGVQKGTQLIDKGLKEVGYKEPETLVIPFGKSNVVLNKGQKDEITEALNYTNEMGAQFLVGGVAGKLGSKVKTKLGGDKVPDFNVIKESPTVLPDKLAELREKLKTAEQDAVKKKTPQEQGFTQVKPLETKVGFKEVKPPSARLEKKVKEQPIDKVKSEALKIMQEDPSLTSAPKKIVNRLNALKNEGVFKTNFNVENVRTWANEFNEARKQKIQGQKVQAPEVPIEDITLRGFYGKNADVKVGTLLKENPEFKSVIKDIPREQIESSLSGAFSDKRKSLQVLQEAGGRYEGINKTDIMFTNKKRGSTFSLPRNEFTKEKVQEVFANDKTKPIEQLPQKGTKEELAQAFEQTKEEIKSELPDTGKKGEKPTFPDGTEFALKLKDGRIISDKFATNHPDVLEKVDPNGKLKFDDIVEAGYIKDGKFQKDIGSDTQGWVDEKSSSTPTPKVETKDFGSTNKVFTAEKLKQAQEYQKGALGQLSANPFTDPKYIKSLVDIGGYYFEGGIRKLPEWSKKMIEEAGEEIKPHLLKIWGKIQTQGVEAIKQVEETVKREKQTAVKKIVETVPVFEHTPKTFIKSELSTMGEYIRRQGEGGRKLVDTIDKVDRDASQKASQYEQKIQKDLRSISKEDFQEFVNLADKGGDSTNPKVQRLLTEWRNITKEIGQEAKDLGMEVSYYDTANKKFKQKPFEPLENFFPHMWEFDKIKKGERYNKILNNIAESNNISLADAKLALDVFIKRNKESKYGNIDRVRQFNMDGWRTDKAVVTDFIERATKRIEEFKEYGKKYSNVKGMLDQITKEGHDIGNSRLLFDRVVGRDRYSEDWVAYSARINDWQVGTKLTMLSLLNWTQIGNAGLVAGTRSFAKTLGKSIFNKQEMFKFGEQTGALINNTLKHYKNELQSDLGVAEAVMKYTGVLAEERFLRSFSANAISDSFNRSINSLVKNPNNKMLRDKIQRQLNTLNLKDIKIDEVIKNKGLTEKQLLDVGFEGARKTQFLSRPQDLPQILSNKNLKVFTLFKSFITQQTKLIKDSVLKEVTKGNVKPLIFLGTVFPALGEVARTLRDLVAGRDEELKKSLILGGGFKDFKTLAERYVDDLATVGAMGILYDLTKEAARDPQGFMSWVAGATISDISNFIYAGAAATGGNLKPLGKVLAKQLPIPVVQQRLNESLKTKPKYNFNY